MSTTNDRRPMHPQVKTILFVALGGLITLLGFLGKYAWGTVDQKAEQGVEANRRVGLVEKDVGSLQAGQAELKAGQKAILDAVHDLEHR